MDTQTLWLLVLSAATPIAGIVGFAIQLRQVKKGHLENEKLRLEIEALKSSAAKARGRIVTPTTDEVLRFRQYPPLASRHASPRMRPANRAPDGSIFLGSLVTFVVIGIFVGYGLYDLYRLAFWIYRSFF